MRSSFLDQAAARLAALPPTQVLYTDVDGTLVGPDGSLLTGPDGRPSLRAARALVDAADAGIAVVLMSGRRRPQLETDARMLGLSGCVAEAGTVLVRDGVVTYEWGNCPRDVAATPRETIEKSGALGLLLEAFAGDLRPYEPWDHDREGGHLLHGRIDTDRANALLAEHDLDWARVLDNGATGGWPGRDVRAYHLVPNGVGKATGVAADRSARGVETAAAAAVGDSPEDATTASEVGVYFQVANGHGGGEDTVVTPGAMGDGFSQAVGALLARAESV